MTAWFERDQFWFQIYPYMFSPERFQQAAGQTDLLIKLLGVESGRLLDLCCGPGRFAVPVAKRGYQVTAVDRTEFFLAKAREYAEQEQVEIKFITADMDQFIEPAGFHAVINMFTSFGYYETAEQNFQVLQNIFASLKPGGRLLLDTMGKEILARIFQPTKSTQFADGAMLVERCQIINDWTQVKNDWLLIKEGRVESYPWSLTIYSGQELRTLLLQAGFENIRLYGDLSGSEYGLNAQRLIAVAEK